MTFGLFAGRGSFSLSLPRRHDDMNDSSHGPSLRPPSTGASGESRNKQLATKSRCPSAGDLRMTGCDAPSSEGIDRPDGERRTLSSATRTCRIIEETGTIGASDKQARPRLLEPRHSHGQMASRATPILNLRKCSRSALPIKAGLQPLKQSLRLWLPLEQLLNQNLIAYCL